MIISNRRRLYSNIITEDNGDIGKISDILLFVGRGYSFLVDDLPNIFEPRKYLNLKQTDVGSNNFTTTFITEGSAQFSIPVMKLSDKISSRFEYNTTKINNFLSDYSIDMDNDGNDYTIVASSETVKFEKYGNDIYLTTNFEGYSNYVSGVDISLKGLYFSERSYNGIIDISENTSPIEYYPGIYLDDISLQFTNLYISDKEFSLIDDTYPTNITWTYKVYEDVIAVPGTRSEIPGYEDELFIKTISVQLPTGVSGNNYIILLESFRINTTVDTSVKVRSNYLDIYCNNYTDLVGGCTVTDVCYYVISW